MLSLQHITKVYTSVGESVTALRDLNIDFREQEFVSILGPSGCGKTTLLNLIGGLDQYTEGDLKIDGVSTKRYTDRDWDTYRNHRIGFVFQSYQLIPHQSVLANVELALTLSGVPKAERRRRATEALERVGLGDQLKKKPNQMSGGQMQRVAIARALVNNPGILLADEPTGALDTQTSEQIMELLKEVSRDRLVIMVTHNPELAQRYSTRIVTLLDGALVSDSHPFIFEEKAEEGTTEAKAQAETKTEIETKTQTVSGTKAAKEKKVKMPQKKKDKKKKTSMSFLTAISLSCNNLLTKKTRTFLTSFAGSIGIIGIALIMALSNGIQLYIDRVEEDALSSFPISLQAVTMDANDLIAALSGKATGEGNHEEGYVYSSGTTIELFSALLSGVKTNDLTAFKKFIESGESALSNPEVASIQYVYSITPYIYHTYRNPETGEEKLVQASPSSMLSNLMSTASGGGSQLGGMSAYTVSLFDQLLDKRELLESQYEKLSGEWPSAYDEVVLITDANNEINDLYLYGLGLKDPDELEKIIRDIYAGKAVEAKSDAFSYESLLSQTFDLAVAGDLYDDTDGDGIFEFKGEDETFVKNLAAQENGRSVKLKIVGIVRPNKDAAATSASGIIGYTSALTDYLIEQGKETDVVKAQLKTPDIDVLTGLPFESKTGDDKTDEQKAEEIKPDYSPIGRTPDELRVLYTKMLQAIVQQQQILGARSIVRYIKENIDGWEEYCISFVIAPAVADNSDRVAEYMGSEFPIGSAVDENTVKMVLSSGFSGGTVTSEDIEQYALLLLAGFGNPSNIGAVALSSYENALSAKTVPLEGMSDMELTAAYTADYDALETEVLVSLWNRKYEKVSENTYRGNMIDFGLTDADSPTAINIYPISFDKKEQVQQVITDYNSTHGQEQQITYTDFIGVLFSSISIVLNVVTYVLIAFVAISLLVSSIMIGIITYISVLERTREIGILRAIGASKGDISRVFNAETLIVGLSAGVIGILGTLILILPINLIIRWLSGISSIGASLPVGGAILLIVISMLLTLISGLIPSRMAAKKDPVEALRSE